LDLAELSGEKIEGQRHSTIELLRQIESCFVCIFIRLFLQVENVQAGEVVDGGCGKGRREGEEGVDGGEVGCWRRHEK